MMWDFTVGYIRQLDEKRREDYAAIQTPEDLDALRTKVRNRLAEMWGPMPAERTPLNPNQVGSIERPGVRDREDHLREPPQILRNGQPLSPPQHCRALARRDLPARPRRRGQGIQGVSEIRHRHGPFGLRRAHLGPHRPGRARPSFGTRRTTGLWSASAPRSTACWDTSATCWAST